MPAPIKLLNHFTTEQLKHKFYNCPRAQEKLRWHGLYLLSQGLGRGEVTEKLSRSSSWVTDLVKRYNAEAAAGIENKKRGKSNHRACLTEELGKELVYCLQSKAADEGLWTGRKVAQWIEEKTGRKVNPATGWRVTQRLGFSLQVPRPAHRKKASAQEQEDWKKN